MDGRLLEAVILKGSDFHDDFTNSYHALRLETRFRECHFQGFSTKNQVFEGVMSLAGVYI
jgi:hypothetical protein